MRTAATMAESLSRYPRSSRVPMSLYLMCLFAFFSMTGYSEEMCDLATRRCEPFNCSNLIPAALSGFFRGEQKPRYHCRCDKMCGLYGDCCVDYWDHCVDETDPPVTTSPFSPFFECVPPLLPLNDDHFGSSFFAVGRCPPDWPQDDIRRNCQDETLAMTQKLLTLFVNGPGEIIFKNVYCALCHGVQKEHLEPWSVKLWNCDERFNDFDWELLDVDQCVQFELIPPLSVSSSMHRCYPDYVDSCPPNATESQMMLCASYTSIILGPEDAIAYKNEFCANCHSYPRDKLRCDIFKRGGFYPSTSYTLLFDFTGHTVSLRTGDESQETIWNCNQWQVYDPFRGECRNLSCPVGMTLLTGKCVGEHRNTRLTLYSHGASDNAITDCFQQLVSSQGIATYLEGTLSELVTITFGKVPVHQTLDNTTNVYDQIYVHADFSIARQIQAALEDFVSARQAGSVASQSPCSETGLMLVSFSKDETNASQLLPICEGFTIPGVQLTMINVTDGVSFVAEGGYMYGGSEFMHSTKYKSAAANVSDDSSKEVCLVLCSPFIDESCPVISYDRSDFLSVPGTDEALYVHKDSGVAISSDDIWQLPDDTLRMCNFLPEAEPPVYLAAWLSRLSDVSVAGSIVSIVCLLIAFITYSIFPDLRNQPGKIVMNLMVALILGQASLIFGKTSTQWLCVLRATCLHFSWLSTFSWMTLLSHGVALSIKSRMIPDRRRQNDGCEVFKLGVVAWGFPALFVAVCFLVSRVKGPDHSEVWLEYGGSNCWIVDPIHSLVVFGVPVLILLAINCILLVFMIFMVIGNKRRLARLQMATNTRKEILLCLKLIVVTGMSWCLLFAANTAQSVGFWYLAVLVNSLQGAAISLTFLLKGKVLTLWKTKLRGMRCRGHRLCLNGCCCCCGAETVRVAPAIVEAIATVTSGERPTIRPAWEPSRRAPITSSLQVGASTSYTQDPLPRPKVSGNLPGTVVDD